MEIILYHSEYELHESIDNFLDQHFGREMTYLASDLLREGLTPADILEALQRAMTACRTSGENMRCHFKPVYTQYQDSLVRDCKLSRLAYALVLLNAKPHLPATANWQLELTNFFLTRQKEPERKS